MKLKLKVYRKMKGFTQEDVYRNICSKRHYNRIENHKCEPSVLLAYSFAKRLNISLEALIEPDLQELININNNINAEYDF